MKKFEGVLFCTDLDGTLFANDKTISKQNFNAIEYFKSDIYPLAPLMLDEDAGEDGMIQKWIETLK